MPFKLQDDPPRYSRIVVVNGQEQIQLPDGKMIPFGMGVVCTEECEQATVLTEPSTSVAWLKWAAVGAVGGLLTYALLRDCCCALPPIVYGPPVIGPPFVRPPTVEPPITPVPEPDTLMMLGMALALLSWPLRKRS